MSFLKGILTDLRHRKLWPVPLALIAAIVAVPVVLAKKPQSARVPPAPSAGEPTSNTPAAAISVSNSTGKLRVSGHGRDPFTQQAVASAATSVGTAIGTVAASSGGTSVSVGSAGLGGSPSVSVSGSSAVGLSGSGGFRSLASSGSSVNNHAPAPAAKPPLPQRGLTSTEAYHVALSITNPAGGIQPIDPLVRLSPLPNDQQPLLLELGVRQGTNDVLFAVEPGAVLNGPGSCIPGPIDCEILSLAPGQTESAAPSGSSQSATLFQVTDLSVDRYATAAQASKARAAVSRTGSQLLTGLTSSTLSLFQFDPTIDAVVDLRNLTVGGN